MIQFTLIEQLQEGDWHFTWNGGPQQYRVILNGQQIDTTSDGDYVFQGLGYTDYPPPLEIQVTQDLAGTELDRPFLRMQWYRDLGASSYSLQQYVNGAWIDYFTISNTSSFVYTVDSPTLVDGTVYQFQLISYNDTDDASPPLGFSVNAIVHPAFVDTAITVTYNIATHSIEITLV